MATTTTTTKVSTGNGKALSSQPSLTSSMTATMTTGTTTLSQRRCRITQA